jgi:hypothetical protein
VIQQINTTFLALIPSIGCGTYTEAQMNFTVARAGTIVITASIYVVVFHSSGNNTNVYVNLWRTTSDCTTNSESMGVESQQVTAGYTFQLPLLQSFVVPAAGTYSFYVNGGASYTSSESALFEGATVVGVFYPA